jgi:PIN domain nuclease of toxin-antitoxin system
VKLLLDTHIWLWSLLEPERLSRRVVQALENPGNELWLSPISTWELGILVQKGRLELGQEVGAWVGRALTEVPLKEAPLTHEIALAAPRIALSHQDPADRFLAATAKVLGLTLVTGDDRLLEAEGFSILANR